MNRDRRPLERLLTALSRVRRGSVPFASHRKGLEKREVRSNQQVASIRRRENRRALFRRGSHPASSFLFCVLTRQTSSQKTPRGSPPGVLAFPPCPQRFATDPVGRLDSLFRERTNRVRKEHSGSRPHPRNSVSKLSKSRVNRSLKVNAPVSTGPRKEPPQTPAMSPHDTRRRPRQADRDLPEHDRRAASEDRDRHALVTGGRRISLHDTQIFGEQGEDGGPGLLPALRRFLREHPEWSVVYHTQANHGLTVSKSAARWSGLSGRNCKAVVSS